LIIRVIARCDSGELMYEKLFSTLMLCFSTFNRHSYK
jgi:hypothetical protein